MCFEYKGMVVVGIELFSGRGVLVVLLIILFYVGSWDFRVVDVSRVLLGLFVSEFMVKIV